MKLIFKQQVKRAMMEKGWNVQDLAAALGKHPGTVYRTLQVNNPHASTLKSYARALGKPLEYFV